MLSVYPAEDRGETEICSPAEIRWQSKKSLMLKLANNFHVRYEEAAVNSGGG